MWFCTYVHENNVCTSVKIFTLSQVAIRGWESSWRFQRWQEVNWKTTLIWEAEKTPTINLVINRVYTMIENLKKFASTASNSGSGIMFARELIKQLETRFPAYGSRVHEYFPKGAYILPPMFHVPMFHDLMSPLNKKKKQ